MTYSDATFLLILLLIAWSLYRVHLDPNSALNVFDLVMDNGRLGRMAVVFLGGVFVLSWIMVRLTLTGKMTEGYMGLYGAIVITPLVAKLFSPPPAPPVPGTVTTDTSTHKTTTTKKAPK